MTIKLKTFVTVCIMINAICVEAALLQDPYDSAWVGTTWDLSKDWSDTQNPNAPWVYGKATPSCL